MTIPRLEAMQAYWREHPPLHLMVEAFMGIDSKKPQAQLDESGNSLFDLFPQTPAK